MNHFGFIILPFIEKDTLLKLLINANNRGNRLSHEAQRYLCADVVRCLATLHKTYAIAHLDLKPDNIAVRLNTASQLKTSLIDFGSSAPLTAHVSRWSTTLNYVPPEVYPFYNSPARYAPRPYLAEKTDIFSLGLTMFIILFQVSPFGLSNEEGRSDPKKDYFYKLLHSNPVAFL